MWRHNATFMPKTSVILAFTSIWCHRMHCSNWNQAKSGPQNRNQSTTFRLPRKTAPSRASWSQRIQPSCLRIASIKSVSRNSSKPYTCLTAHTISTTILLQEASRIRQPIDSWLISKLRSLWWLEAWSGSVSNCMDNHSCCIRYGKWYVSHLMIRGGGLCI